MKIKEEALELLKKFADGAPCPVDFNKIEETMFWSWLVQIAKEQGLVEIDVETVKRYWFFVHNGLVKKRFEIGLGKLDKKTAENCMVSVGEQNGELYCFHGGKLVCPISKKEAELIKSQTPEL